MAARVRDIDRGYRDIERQIRALDQSFVTVGIHEDKRTRREIKGMRLKEPGLSMAQIGAQNEFGTRTIPQRSFIRSTIDEQSVRIQSFMTNQYTAVLQQRQTARAALATVGVFVEGLVRQKIRAIRFPPNSARTIAIKGSSKPLIDFGQMIQSIASVVSMR